MIRRMPHLLKNTLVYQYVQFWYRGRLFVLTVTVLAAVIAIAYLTSQKKEYLSESEFIPPNFYKLPVLAGGEVIPGEAEDIARVIAYLSSEQIKGKLVQTFNIIDRYNLRSSNPKTQAKKIKSYMDENVSIFRTKSQTIRLKTYDINPDTAYLINLFLLQELENFCRSIAKYQDYYQQSQSAMDSLKAESKDLEDKLADFRYRYKVFTLSDAQDAPTQTAIQLMLSNPDALKQYDKVVSMETRLRRLQEIYVRLYERLDEIRALLGTYTNLVIMVDPPYKSEFPERPKLLRVTVLTAFIAFALSSALTIYLGLVGLLEVSEEPQERQLIAEKA
jgi:uncharacterized protein involved in exopolysaccharide biosynthesis